MARRMIALTYLTVADSALSAPSSSRKLDDTTLLMESLSYSSDIFCAAFDALSML